MVQPMMQGAATVRFVEQPPTPYNRPPSTPMPATPAPQQVAIQPTSIPSVPVASPSFTPISQYPTPSPSSGQPTMGPSPLYAMETSPAFAPAPTPGAPVSNKGPSPSGVDTSSTNEQPGYREKVIELLVYLDMLKRIIDQQQREGTAIHFQTLLKFKSSSEWWTSSKDVSKSIISVGERNRNICQPLIEALSFALKQRGGKGLNLSSCFGHLTLPTMAEQKLCSSEWLGLVKEKSNEFLTVEDNADQIPISIRREVALLDPKFQVQLETDELPLKSSWKNLHVVCTLHDPTLPSVPPLYLRIPLNYPQALPKYDMEKTSYGGSALLLSVKKSLLALSYDTASFKTISFLLNHWVLAVRKASSLMESNDESTLSEFLLGTEQNGSNCQQDEAKHT
ncbi:hypothetical protein D918_06699 [Trichuris suis]|nr:hypothetical protein D918_06699 [Trichuris suis]